jgi:hypothetical protein
MLLAFFSPFYSQSNFYLLYFFIPKSTPLLINQPYHSRHQCRQPFLAPTNIQTRKEEGETKRKKKKEERN